MVTDDLRFPEGPTRGDEGRSAEELHKPIPYSLSERGRRAAGRFPDTISERLDGAYIPDSGQRDARAVHGWFYPDPRSGEVSEVYEEAA